ncbi:MAG: hypothetical protein Q6356_000505 [Candidatus Wukongarchaeota archaeon]|nr:hypothetical protein [Candidatus Wukongarchaeota archaeon]
MVALTIILSGGRLEGKILKKMHERIIKKLHGYHNNDRAAKRLPQRLRCYLIHS